VMSILSGGAERPRGKCQKKVLPDKTAKHSLQSPRALTLRPPQTGPT
jgi:hypothetical protein